MSEPRMVREIGANQYEIDAAPTAGNEERAPAAVVVFASGPHGTVEWERAALPVGTKLYAALPEQAGGALTEAQLNDLIGRHFPFADCSEADDKGYRCMVALLRAHEAALTAARAPAAGGALTASIDPMRDPMRPSYFMNYAKDETRAEMVLRKLACWLGVGGYNATVVDADLFHRKIVDGIEMLLTTTARATPAGPSDYDLGKEHGMVEERRRWEDARATPAADARDAALALAIRFHETYEKLAPSFGYETRPDTKVFDPESKNGRLMVAVCAAIAKETP